MYIVKTVLIYPLLPLTMESFRISDLRSLIKEIVTRRIETATVKEDEDEDDSDEDDLDEIFLGFTEEQIQVSLNNMKKRQKYIKPEIVDERIRTCSVNLSQSEILIKDVYIGNNCTSCKELKGNISIPINYAKNQSIGSNSPVKLKKVVLKVFREHCFISLSIPENVTICTECKDENHK